LKSSKPKSNPTSKNTHNIAEIERVKLDLLSLVSHELRTPLTSILNSLKLLQEGEITKQERQKFFEMAQRNAEKLNHTLNELLDLSKLVSGQLVCRFQELPLKNLLLAQLEKWAATAEEQGHTLVASEVPDLPGLLGDGPRLAQVFNSLFENALKFSPVQSEIYFKVRAAQKAKQEGVEIEFKNFVMPTQAKSIDLDILKIFSQRETVLDRVHEGVGGSLAIASEVLRQHGGS
jgi:signal transduction histidine kinase